jgi:hypothetical protein
MNKNLSNQISINRLNIKIYLNTLFPAVAPTRHGRLPLNFPAATVRGKTLLANCNENTGTSI